MAKVTYYLDARKLRKDGTASLRIAIRNLNQTAYIPTSIYARPEQWDAEGQRMRDFPRNKSKEHPNKTSVNQFLLRRKILIEDIISNLPSRMPAQAIRESVLKSLEKLFGIGERDEKELFMHAYESYTSSRRSERTKEIYTQTARSMARYDDHLSERTFDEIDLAWIEGFDTFLSATSPSPNARAIHLRNIRAVFNQARKDDLTTAYPFTKFRIKTIPTAKRSMTAESLRTLFSFDGRDYSLCDEDCERIRRYIDIFKLSFLLRGINMADLFALRKEQLINGRIEFNRAKTGTFYSIKVEPEAMRIIERYPGTEHLLYIGDHFKSCRNFIRAINSNLKSIGKTRKFGSHSVHAMEGKSLFPHLSTYWARHSWATIGAELEIPIETISAGLGHKIGSKVTLVYVTFSQKKVDDANRSIIDYVLYDKKR